MALSVVAIKAAKVRDKSYELSDSDGLYLLLTPSGGPLLAQELSPPRRDASARYVVVDCRSETHIPLQRLLQSLISVYDTTRMNQKRRPGFVSFRQRTFADAPELGNVPHGGM